MGTAQLFSLLILQSMWLAIFFLFNEPNGPMLKYSISVTASLGDT